MSKQKSTISVRKSEAAKKFKILKKRVMDTVNLNGSET